MNKLKQYHNQIIIFLVLLTCYIYFLPRWASWSQNSRLNLVLAIVDEGTLKIDSYVQNTGDYFCFNRETGLGGCNNGGNYYSDKAPGVALLGVPVYAVVRPVLRSFFVQSTLERIANHPAFEATLNADGTGVRVDKVYYAVVLYLVTMTIIALPSAILGVLVFNFLNIFACSTSWRILIALLFGLATIAFPYSGMLFSHQLVAFLLFASFYVAFLIGRRKLSPQWTVVIGLMLGYSVISEYPAALIAASVFLYTLVLLPNRRWIVAVIVAGLLPGLLMMWYDWAIFKNILPLGYRYSELYRETVHSEGFISLVGPNMDAMWGITFGSFRGLFFIAPILLLTLPGFFAWLKQGQYRLELLVTVWATISFFLFNGSSVMWHGGFAVGPRYLVPMLPFMTMGLGTFVATWGTNTWARLLVALLGIWSFLVVWIQTIGGQSFPDWTPNPLFHYSFPKLIADDVARNLGMMIGFSGLKSLIPLILMLTLYFIVWQVLQRLDYQELRSVFLLKQPGEFEKNDG